MGEQQHQPLALQPIHDETQRLQRYRVGPVQILDNDEQRRLRKAPFEDDADCEENLTAELCRLNLLRGGIRIGEAEHMEIERHQPFDLAAGKAKFGECFEELRLRLRCRCVVVDLVGAAQHRRERAVRLLAQRRAGGPPDGHVGEALVLTRAGEEFVDEACLADAGLADQPHQLSCAAARQLEAADHVREVGVASDQRCAQAQRFQSARRARRVERSAQPMDEDASALAAKRRFTEGFKQRTRGA